MQTLRKVYHRPFGFPMPTALLKMGAIIIGTETELILKSRWVYPQYLLNEGFTFNYPNLISAASTFK